jgi:hypothetical protein
MITKENIDLKMQELIDEFLEKRFGSTASPSYKKHWHNRYKKDGIDFICQMDSESRSIFSEILNNHYFKNI